MGMRRTQAAAACVRERLPDVSGQPADRRTEKLGWVAVGHPAGAGDGFLRGHGAGSEDMALKMTVVALSRADLCMTQLALDAHQRGAGSEPRGGRCAWSASRRPYRTGVSAPSGDPGLLRPGGRRHRRRDGHLPSRKRPRSAPRSPAPSGGWRSARAPSRPAHPDRGAPRVRHRAHRRRAGVRHARARRQAQPGPLGERRSRRGHVSKGVQRHVARRSVLDGLLLPITQDGGAVHTISPSSTALRQTTMVTSALLTVLAANSGLDRRGLLGDEGADVLDRQRSEALVSEGGEQPLTAVDLLSGPGTVLDTGGASEPALSVAPEALAGGHDLAALRPAR